VFTRLVRERRGKEGREERGGEGKGREGKEDPRECGLAMGLAK